MLILTKTVSGRNHDYSIFKKRDIQLPPNILSFFDLGFYGIEKDYPKLADILPVKKQKGKELSPIDKRYKCTSDKFRNKRNKTADDFILLSAGLWNFHLKKSA